MFLLIAGWIKNLNTENFDLNTSHVLINREMCRRGCTMLNYLNTSHVLINLLQEKII